MANFDYRKLLVILIALFTYDNICKAEENEAVVIMMSDGESFSYDLSQKPVITYIADNLVLKSTNVDVSLPMGGIKEITFVKVSTGVQLKSASSQENVKVTTDEVYFTGFQPGEQVSLYHINGVQISHYTISDNGSLQISLSDLRSGIYIIKAGRSTIKIAR